MPEGFIDSTRPSHPSLPYIIPSPPPPRLPRLLSVAMGQLISAIRGKDIAQVYIDFESQRCTPPHHQPLPYSTPPDRQPHCHVTAIIGV